MLGSDDIRAQLDFVVLMLSYLPLLAIILPSLIIVDTFCLGSWTTVRLSTLRILRLPNEHNTTSLASNYSPANSPMVLTLQPAVRYHEFRLDENGRQRWTIILEVGSNTAASK